LSVPGSLAEFAKGPRNLPGACSVCDLFARLPELRTEVDAGRSLPHPISYENIAGYVKLKYNVRLASETYRRHYGGHP
jgi:hypothetical protein